MEKYKDVFLRKENYGEQSWDALSFDFGFNSDEVFVAISVLDEDENDSF